LTDIPPTAPIGIFGGTFDPIHFGHLRSALELQQRLRLARVHFVPCGDPPHRSAPMTDGPLRLRLVKAAIADEPQFVADDRELRRPGRSYTIDTLTSFRAEFPRHPLCLLLGMDAFLGLPRWHRWRELLDLAHIVVARRPGWQAPVEGTLGELLAERKTASHRDLHESLHGRVHVEAVTQLEISSTELRSSIRAGLDPKFLMPDSVRRIILETECYAENPKSEDRQEPGQAQAPGG
jgi:nicotinate-nucleotide adenylyltransferase